MDRDGRPKRRVALVLEDFGASGPLLERLKKVTTYAQASAGLRCVDVAVLRDSEPSPLEPEDAATAVETGPALG